MQMGKVSEGTGHRATRPLSSLVAWWVPPARNGRFLVDLRSSGCSGPKVGPEVVRGYSGPKMGLNGAIADRLAPRLRISHTPIRAIDRDTSMVKGTVWSPIALEVSGAARVFARRAIKITCEAKACQNPTDLQKRIYAKRVMEYTIGAVVMSVAGLEGAFNESIGGASQGGPFKGGPRGNVSGAAYIRWASAWDAGVFRRLEFIERCQFALALADLDPMPVGQGVVEDVRALVRLRNALVHAENKGWPMGPNLSDRSKLEQNLANRFELNPLQSWSDSVIWGRFLGEGCAKWAVESSTEFWNQFSYDRLAYKVARTELMPWDWEYEGESLPE